MENTWQEISEDDYEYALGVLPPEKWKTVNGVNIFRWMEHTDFNLTAHFASYRGKYYKAQKRLNDDYAVMAKEVYSKHLGISLN